MCEGPLTSIRCLKRHSDGGHVGVGITSCFASVSFRVEMELEGRRRALCAAMRHSSQCRFNNCDKIDGACGKTKRIIKASADTLCESHATWGKHFLAARPIRTLHLEGKFCKKVSSLPVLSKSKGTNESTSQNIEGFAPKRSDCSAARRQLLLERARWMPHLQRGLRHGLLARQDLLRRQVHRALLPDDQEMPSARNHPREGLLAT